MSKRTCSRAAPAALAGVAALAACAPALGADSQWVRVGQSGRLVHTMDDRGDRVMDFSTVGYRGGAVPLPNYAAVVTPDRIVNVSPVAGDNLAAIQAAVTTVGNLVPNANGFRGVVQLAPGNYDISNRIDMIRAGVILRGAGDGADPATNTILSYTGTQRINMIHVDSAATRSNGATFTIADKVVPAGATSLTVESTAGLSVGGRVLVHRPATEQWFNDIGMNALPMPWTVGSTFHQQYERKVTYIDQARKRVFFDAPIANSIEKKYAEPDGQTGRLIATTWNRIQDIGIENIRGNGQKVLTTPDSEEHADSFVRIVDSENVWVKNVTGQHLIYATVRVDQGTTGITVDEAAFIDPVSTVQGARRYPFQLSGQMALMKNLTSDQGRHDFVNNNPSRGPNVFLDGVATNSFDDSGPHQRWSTGTLFDNITTTDRINVQNRHDLGTGHGWSGANMVVWNSTADDFFVQNPPGAQNWLIGSTGTVAPGTSMWVGGVHPAYYDANNAGSPVTLGGETSLYRAQLNQRVARPHERMREYWVGDYDGFENLAGDGDDVYVEPAWAAQSLTLGGATLGGLDKPADADRGVALTFEFDVPGGESVAYALLTLATKPVGDGAADDRVWIDGESSIAFSDLATPPSFNGTDIVTLELIPSESGGVLDFLQDGRLNLLIADDHAVDWANLQLTFVPEPTFLGTCVLALPVLLRRRRR